MFHRRRRRRTSRSARTPHCRQRGGSQAQKADEQRGREVEDVGKRLAGSEGKTPRTCVSNMATGSAQTPKVRNWVGERVTAPLSHRGSQVSRYE
eukprot:6192392-Pleurochrysis_carterae.AAC.4